jgi:hypothetical protein
VIQYNIHVTSEQLAIIELEGKNLLNQLKSLDNVESVCYDDWYGPYIYMMVREDDEQTLVEASELVDDFVGEMCLQQPNLHKTVNLTSQTAR